MNALDILLVLILGGSAVAGLWSGFARVGIAFAALVVGIPAGLWFYGVPAAWINDYIHSKTASNLIGFFFIVALFVTAGAAAGWVLAKMFKWTGLSFLDRILGAGFGFVRGMLLAVAFVAVLMAFAPKPPPKWIVESKGLPYVLGASSVIAALAPQSVKDAFHDSVRELERLWDEHMKRKPKTVEARHG